MRGHVPRTVGRTKVCVVPSGRGESAMGYAPAFDPARERVARGDSRGPQRCISLYRLDIVKGHWDPTSAEVDFQLPARQLTPQARERDQRSL